MQAQVSEVKNIMLNNIEKVCYHFLCSEGAYAVVLLLLSISRDEVTLLTCVIHLSLVKVHLNPANITHGLRSVSSQLFFY